MFVARSELRRCATVLSARPARTVVGVAAGAACAAFALTTAPAAAAVFTVTKSADTVIDTRGMTLDSSVAAYGIGINGTSFENNAITTFNGYQYTAYWVRTGTTSTSNYVAIARRPTGATTWQVANLTASVFTNGLNGTKPSDAHNVVSMGIDETDGTIHLAYDLHGHTLKYRVSNTGVASNPSAISAAQWTQSLFQTQRNWLVNSATPVNTVTYPHFIRENDGSLQLTYRTGSSGSGSNWMTDYNGQNQTWGNVHQYDDGFTGTYTGTVTTGDANRNSYINGATYGPTGRLYQSFTWREGATGAANHDLNFVYSDDKGNTWKNNTGTVVASNASGTKFGLNSPGLTVVALDESQSTMNQQTQAVTSDDKFHTVMWHKDTAKAIAGATSVYSPTESSYFDYWRDNNGNFHRNKLPGNVGSRPKLFFDANDNAYAIYQLGSFSSAGIYINNGDLVIAAATKANNWADWKVIKTESGPFVSEAQADARLLALTGTLSVTMQASPGVTTPAQATNMRAIDYTFAVTPAVDRTFTAPGGNWAAATNWGGVVPAGNANAIVSNFRDVTLNTAAADLDGNLVVGSGDSTAFFTLAAGGSLNVASSVLVGRDGNATGRYTQTGGTLNSWRFAVGDYSTETSGGGLSTAEVTGGTLTTGELLVGMGGSTARGSSFTAGGTANVTVNGEVLLGDLNGYGVLNVSGGTMTVNGTIREGFNGNNASLVNVTGGTLDVTGNEIAADSVNLTGGTLRNALSINTLTGTGGTITRTTTGAATLTVDDGDFGGSIQNGAATVGLNKITGGTLTLSGANTYTGTTTITAGVLRAASSGALGSPIGNTVIAGGTSDVRLEIAGDIGLAEPLNLGGRQPVGAGNLAPHVRNVSGTNTLTGTISTAVGGSQYNVASDGGKLIVAGNFVNNGTGGASDVRTLKLMGTADGEWRSALANGGSATTAITKLGNGTWTLSGSNTYTGLTTVNGGTLRATAAAYATLLNGVSGVDLQDGSLVLDYAGGTSPVAQVKAGLDANAAGRFAGGQIRSSTLAAGRTIGYGDNGSLVTVRITLPGDATLDGTVDFNDFLALQNNYNKADTRFDQGNFDYTGGTDFNDFLALQNNFGKSLTGPTVSASAEQLAAMTAFGRAVAVVPEPATLAVIGLVTVGLVRRKRR